MVSSNIPSGSGKKDKEKTKKGPPHKGCSGVQGKESPLEARRERRKKKHHMSWFLRKTQAPPRAMAVRGGCKISPHHDRLLPHLTSSYDIVREEPIRNIKARSESAEIQSWSISILPKHPVLACHGRLLEREDLVWTMTLKHFLITTTSNFCSLSLASLATNRT